ncbi:fatty acyl-AMP ligase [Micromonospora sp. NPDC048898]|uniref:fatty acyl-AMP ligase n=1 Tax=Micromonospora sp. NPDC048898 TaxID=3364260 RepID=UPI0037209555
MIELLQRNALNCGDHPALRVSGQPTLTWAEVDQRARAVARSLGELVGPGDRVVLAFPLDVDFLPALFGCWYAGAVAVPVPPGRAGEMAAMHAQARASITTAELAESVPGTVLTVPAAVSAPVGPVPDRPVHDLALIQYTSGSTGVPKGVLVSHRNYRHNLRMLDEFYRGIAPQVDDLEMVSWLPHFHDMGLALMMYTVLRGGTMTMISPLAFLKDPASWLRTIGEVGGNLTAAPNFAFDLCVRRVPADTVEQLDLSSMRALLNAAEPVRPDTMRQFAEHFRLAGLRAETVAPCYGLAENTVFVSGVRPRGGPRTVRFDRAALQTGFAVEDPAAGLELVSCGLRPEGLAVRIVDPQSLEECPPGQLGEIWLHGPSVAHGYWQGPTSDVFNARLAGSFDDQPYFRTGDRGFLWETELFVCGRLADLIRFNGRLLQPEDIEHAVERGVAELNGRRCAVVPYGVQGEQLAMAAEIRLELPLDDRDRDAIESAIRKMAAAEHSVDIAKIVLLPTGAIPVTTSGKVKRTKTRDLVAAAN